MRGRPRRGARPPPRRRTWRPARGRRPGRCAAPALSHLVRAPPCSAGVTSNSTLRRTPVSTSRTLRAHVPGVSFRAMGTATVQRPLSRPATRPPLRSLAGTRSGRLCPTGSQPSPRRSPLCLSSRAKVPLSPISVRSRHRPHRGEASRSAAVPRAPPSWADSISIRMWTRPRLTGLGTSRWTMPAGSTSVTMVITLIQRRSLSGQRAPPQSRTSELE